MNEVSKKPFGIDLPVLLIFFARPNTLQKVFETVKKARPSILFLACDGARDSVESEAERVEQCKRIVEDIDWECTVYYRYSDVNLGCGRGPESAISWAFEYVDRLVVLEDDCVPDDSFYPYMKELLDRYANDERVGLISGFNHFKEWDAGKHSYLFTKTGATLGWGTWKRVWRHYDYHVDLINDKYCESLLRKEFYSSSHAKKRISGWKKASVETKQKKVNYWDVQFGFVKYSQSYLCVVPKHNLIYNIGVGIGSTHTASNEVKEWKFGQVLFMPTKSLELPLVHPEFVICDRNYDEQCSKKILRKSFVKKLFGKIKRTVFK